jgi:hypothetical protein
LDANSGYLKYVLGRKYIYGIIGKEMFPANVFRRKVEWNDAMSGILLTKPLFVYRKVGAEFQQLEWLLQAGPPENGCNETMSWALFWLDKDSGKPTHFTNGCGIQTYYETWHEISKTLPIKDTPAFAPIIKQ